MLRELESLTVEVLTDNVSDSYVSKTMFAVSEFANILRAGATVISGETLLGANLGFGLRLQTPNHTMLFDTGPEGPTFIRNCHNLGLDFGAIEEIAVTHGHWDHTAALPHAVEAITKAGRKVKVHVNPDMFYSRAARLADGSIVPFIDIPKPAELEALGATVVNDGNERLLCDGEFWYSGEIPRLSSFEKGRSDHLQKKDGVNYEPDPFLMDERMLVANVKGLGLVVFSACSHAGIVNVCLHARNTFPGIPIHCVMGGLHLGGVMEHLIPDTVAGLKEFNIKYIITGHCTGWRALHALSNEYGDAVSQSAVGTTYTFQA